MRTATPELIALLATKQFVMASLYTLTLNSGTEVMWTGADKDIQFGSDTWTRGPLLTRGTIRHKRGVGVSTFDLTIGAVLTDLIEGLPVIPYIRNRGLDGAELTLKTGFAPTWADPITGTLIDFSGLFTSVKNIGKLEASVVFSSWMVRLNNAVPPDLVQSSCKNTLFDAGCTLDAADYAVLAAVVGSGMTQTIFATSVAQASGYFDQGYLKFTSGANNGLTRAIKSNVGGTITISLPLPVAPAAGDTFTAYPGCDLLSPTCSGKFSNLLHYRGEEFVPTPENSVL